MKRIKVKIDIYSYPLHLTEDNEWRCWHVIDSSEVEVEPPCCTGFEQGVPSCGCGGCYSVYCYDCHNDDMTEDDVINIIDGRIGND